MDRSTLRDIIFESKQFHRQTRTHHKRSQLGHRTRDQYPNKIGSICLLGSLEIPHKPIPIETQINKFQIVQLKKHKSTQPKRQQSKYDAALKSQLKNRQIRSHRQSFKIDKIQHSQLGVFQKSLPAKFMQTPNYLLEGQITTNSRASEDGRKSERNVNFSHGKSSLNIQLLPEKFIPSQVLSSKEYKRIYEEEKRKIMEQRNQSLKKNIFLDFHSIKFNLSDIVMMEKDSQTPLQPSNNRIQTFPGPQPINRANSMTMTGISRKQYMKKMVDQQKQFQDKIELQKKEALEIRKEVNKNYAKPFNPPENISAQAYIVYEITKKQSRYRKSFQLTNEKKRFLNGHKVLVELNSRTPVEIASLTKIMTLVVVLEICAKLNKDPSQQIIKVGFFEQNITGTSANLCKGEIYTLEQLFYGLMLPSGNDASLAMAVWGGRILIENGEISPIDAETSLIKKKKIFYDRFLQEMNKKAVELGMQKTHYANSHGLMNLDNKSCAFDLALLCEYAMKHEKFREVVKTRTYQCTIQSQKQDSSTIASPTLTNRSSSVNIESEYMGEMKDFYADQSEQFQAEQQGPNQIEMTQVTELQIQTATLTSQKQSQNKKMFTKKVFWENTHMLLQQKNSLYKGIKTGITNSAGPCLASLVEHGQRQFVLIVLNCKSMKQRFRDTQNLRKWTFEKEEIKLKE